jgi:hypothetical protein
MNKEQSMLEKVEELLSTEEGREEARKFFEDIQGPKIPKGWVSIEDHLPMMLAKDVAQGYTLYKCLLSLSDDNNSVIETRVSDHNIWYFEAKEAGITHWWNS